MKPWMAPTTFLILTICLLLSGTSLSSQSESYYQQTDDNLTLQNQGMKLAIIIGINEYDDTQGLSRLEYAVNDARRIKRTLEHNGQYTIRYLADDAEIKPTRENILNGLDLVVQMAQVTPISQLVLYYSGHGFADQDTGVNYLACRDTQMERLAESGINLDELIERIQTAENIHQKIVFLDACRERIHIRAGNRSFEEPQAAGFTLVFSTQPGQLSFEDDSLRGGIFSYFLAQSLQGHGDIDENGFITVGELKLYMEEKMKQWGIANNRSQQPYFHLDGDQVSEQIICPSLLESHFQDFAYPFEWGMPTRITGMQELASFPMNSVYVHPVMNDKVVAFIQATSDQRALELGYFYIDEQDFDSGELHYTTLPLQFPPYGVFIAIKGDYLFAICNGEGNLFAAIFELKRMGKKAYDGEYTLSPVQEDHEICYGEYSYLVEEDAVTFFSNHGFFRFYNLPKAIHNLDHLLTSLRFGGGKGPYDNDIVNPDFRSFVDAPIVRLNQDTLMINNYIFRLYQQHNFHIPAYQWDEETYKSQAVLMKTMDGRIIATNKEGEVALFDDLTQYLPRIINNPTTYLNRHEWYTSDWYTGHERLLTDFDYMNIRYIKHYPGHQMLSGFYRDALCFYQFDGVDLQLTYEHTMPVPPDAQGAFFIYDVYDQHLVLAKTIIPSDATSGEISLHIFEWE